MLLWLLIVKKYFIKEFFNIISIIISQGLYEVYLLSETLFLAEEDIMDIIGLLKKVGFLRSATWSYKSTKFGVLPAEAFMDDIYATSKDDTSAKKKKDETKDKERDDE